MQKKALLTIIGSQDYNGDKDKIEMKTVGTIEHNDDSYVIRYTEAVENSPASLKSKLVIAKDESKVEMTKSGAYSSLLVIEKSKRHLCNYGTEYGDMLMGIFGKNVENHYDESEGHFSFAYEIDVNGAVSSTNDVTIKYKITE